MSVKGGEGFSVKAETGSVSECGKRKLKCESASKSAEQRTLGAKMQVEVFKRYLVKIAVLLWVAMMGFFILPPTMWAMFGLIVAMPAIMMWENFKRDRCLDEDFGQFYYNEYFSVTGETGKFRIINRQFRSYYEMLDRIASQPETIRFRQKEILVVDDETVIAVAEFESPCRMALFFRSFYQHFVVPQIVARGMIEY